MRTSRRTPAQQLKSVALRDHWPAERPPKSWRWRASLVGHERPASGVSPDAGGRDERLRRLEAVLFLAREPLNSRKLSQYANLADGTEARTLVRQLNRLYDEGGRAFRVEQVAGGYQLMTRPQLAGWLRRLEHVPPESRLSAPALETLAVVAYRQPVPRADIEAIRGVSCGEILRQLMERDLIRIGGRSEELGRPYLYTTTRRFLETFGLQSLEKLPQAPSMRGAAAGIPAEEAGDQAVNEVSQESASLKDEKEESEVKVTTATQWPAEELDDEKHLAASFAPQSVADEEEETDYEYEEGEEDEEDEDYEEGEEEYYAEEEEDEELADDDYEEEEWEEVGDEDEDWEDEDADWDEDYEEEEEDEEDVE